MAELGRRERFDRGEDGLASLTQNGALCWRMHRDRVEVLLITSRDTGRWVIPKGWPIEGMGSDAAAAREAWEEAGVEGAVSPDCVGLFSYVKRFGLHAGVPCVVAVYSLRVTGLARDFPERKQRRRKWFSLAVAARKVAEPELRTLLLGFSPAAAPTTAP